MTKHIPQSLLERAAELYDFGAALRAPAPVAAPERAPVAEPAPVAAAPASGSRASRSAGRSRRCAPSSRGRPPAPSADAVAEIDRAALAASRLHRSRSAGDRPRRGVPADQAPAARRHRGPPRQSPTSGRRSVLICSAQPRAGKTFCAINLALVARRRAATSRCCSSTAISSSPTRSPLLGIESGPGFVDALADPGVDPEAFVIRTDVPGLSVLPAGRKANNVPELLASDRTREVLAKLVAGDRRRIILFDSPPALMASHATVLAGHVGQALVVVRADQTTEADLRETIGLLSGCDHVSLILNGAGLAVTGRKFGAYDGYGHEA